MHGVLFMGLVSAFPIVSVGIAGTAVKIIGTVGIVRAGVVLPHPIDDARLKLQSMFVQRVHGSLSRHYHIFRKDE